MAELVVTVFVFFKVSKRNLTDSPANNMQNTPWFMGSKTNMFPPIYRGLSENM